MSVEIIQAKYEQLNEIGQTFRQEAENSQYTVKLVQQCINNLRSSGWQGVAARSFFTKWKQKCFQLSKD